VAGAEFLGMPAQALQRQFDALDLGGVADVGQMGDRVLADDAVGERPFSRWKSFTSSAMASS
jgi:hypothetical protein